MAAVRTSRAIFHLLKSQVDARRRNKRQRYELIWTIFRLGSASFILTAIYNFFFKARELRLKFKYEALSACCWWRFPQIYSYIFFFCCSEYVDTAVAQDKELRVEVRQKEMKKRCKAKSWGGRKKKHLTTSNN